MLETEQFSKLLLSYSCGISYTPLASEVDPLEIYPGLTQKILYTVQPNPSLVPAHEMKVAKEIVSNRVFIFIPGRLFDVTGTRHGKGGGWYDRFLSIAPAAWLRIGFCYDEQFSFEPLVRQVWDEPMDFVCVVNKNSQNITCYETFSRVY